MQRNGVLLVGPLPGGFGKLGSELSGMGVRVLLTSSFDDARSILRTQIIDRAIVDIECATFDEVEELVCHWRLSVVCIHRLADNELWLKTLAAGAIDCCRADDHCGILEALASSRSHACAAAA